MTPFRQIGPLIALILMSAVLSSCNEPAAMYEMAALDRAYIPALMLTSEPDTSGKSVMAVKELKIEFMVFKSRSSDYVGWDDSVGKVEELIMKADLNINANDHKAAHAALEGIRYQMYDLRKDAGISDYILDRMTEFHEVMEQIVKTLQGKSPETVSSRDLSSVSSVLPRAQERWEAVAASPFNPKVFQFTEGKADRLREQFGKERSVLAALGHALARKDAAATLALAKEMKEEYAKALKMFGNFGALSLGAS